jgi:hypothetical protein
MAVARRAIAGDASTSQKSLHREWFVQHLDQALSVSAVAATSKNGVAISLNSTNIIYAASTATNSDQFTYTVSDGSLRACLKKEKRIKHLI